MASGNRSPASDFGLWLTLAIVALGAPATLFSVSAPCVVVAALVAVVPLVGASFARGRLGLGVRVAEPFVFVIAALALRALLLPASVAVSLEVLVGSLIAASIAAARQRARPSRLRVPPARQALAIALALVSLVKFWSDDRARPNLDLAWEDQWAVLERPSLQRLEPASDLDAAGPYVTPPFGPCTVGACTFVIDGTSCVSVDPEGIGPGPASEPLCPRVQVRRAPGSNGLMVATDAEWPDEVGTHNAPRWLERYGQLGAAVSPWDLGLIGAPFAWRTLALAGILASSIALAWPWLRRRRPQTVPAMGPYRTAPVQPADPTVDESAAQRYARLVLAAATFPCFFMLAAALVAGPPVAPRHTRSRVTDPVPLLLPYRDRGPALLPLQPPADLFPVLQEPARTASPVNL